MSACHPHSQLHGSLCAASAVTSVLTASGKRVAIHRQPADWVKPSVAVMGGSGWSPCCLCHLQFWSYTVWDRARPEKQTRRVYTCFLKGLHKPFQPIPIQEKRKTNKKWNKRNSRLCAMSWDTMIHDWAPPGGATGGKCPTITSYTPLKSFFTHCPLQALCSAILLLCLLFYCQQSHILTEA